MLTLLICIFCCIAGWSVDASPKLDSLPEPTTLSLPEPQFQNGVCYQTSQAGYGPTVGRDGQAISYGPKEDIKFGRDPSRHTLRTPVWARPTIKLSNGTQCCDSLSQVRVIRCEEGDLSPPHMATNSYGFLNVYPLKQVREYIDYLDKTILDYLAIRQQFVVEAGRFKDSKASVRSPTRAVQVVQNAQTLARKNGLAPWLANVSFLLLSRVLSRSWLSFFFFLLK
jgi:chorismate mutase